MADPAKIERMAKALGIPMPKKKKQPYTTAAGTQYPRFFREGLMPESIDKPISTILRAAYSPSSRYPQEMFPVVGARGEMKELLEDARKEYELKLSQRELDLAEQGRDKYGARLDAPWYSWEKWKPSVDLEPGGAAELGIDFGAKLKEIQTGTTPSGYQRGPWRQAGFQMMSLPDVLLGETAFRAISQGTKVQKGLKTFEDAKGIPAGILAARENIYDAAKIFDEAEKLSKAPTNIDGKSIASIYAKSRVSIQNLLNPSQRTNWELMGKIYRTYTAQQAEYQRLLALHSATKGTTPIAKTRNIYKQQAADAFKLDEDIISTIARSATVKGYIEPNAMLLLFKTKKMRQVWNILEEINPFKR